AAHVEHEHVEQRPVGNLAIDASRLRLREAQRHIFMERAAGARREDQCVLLDVFLALMLGAGQRLARPPIVAHLVIVPLREDGDFGVEGTHVLVEQIVFVVAAELGQRLRWLRLFLEYDVFPDLAVRHFLLGEDRAVGVDGVAVVDEEIRAVAQHGGVGALSCPAGRPSISALAVKSDSGNASTKTARSMVLKLSDVATSANMRAGRSARAQITAESAETSPDWMPWVMSGRSAARLR